MDRLNAYREYLFLEKTFQTHSLFSVLPNVNRKRTIVIPYRKQYYVFIAQVLSVFMLCFMFLSVYTSIEQS